MIFARYANNVITFAVRFVQVGLRISTRLEIAESDSEFAMHMAGDDGERTAVANKPVVFTARQFDNNGFVSWTTPLNHRLVY